MGIGITSAASAGFPKLKLRWAKRPANGLRAAGRANPSGAFAEHHGFVPAGSPRVDRSFQRGLAIELGPFRVETFPLVGHTADGSGFRLREQGLLIVGDYRPRRSFRSRPLLLPIG
jgi:glyoxylase-like metal-dependent hydrolase (beta-lactamase superfamily II)